MQVPQFTLAQLQRPRQEKVRNVVENAIQERRQPRGFQLSSLFSWEALGVIIPIAMAVGGWYFFKQRKGKLKDYFEKIDDTYGKFKTEGNRCEVELHTLKQTIEHELKEGKVEEGTYQLLAARIERYLKEVRKKNSPA